MAAIDFPDNPTPGQVFDKWTWNGTVWGLTAQGGGSGFTFALFNNETATTEKQTWFETDTGNCFVWTNDGNSTQWVQFAPSGGAASGGAVNVEVGVKVGTISAWSGDTIPADSLLCNGQVVPAGTAYDQLRAICGTNVPDMRGKFLLGASATYALRGGGGAATHALSVAEMPSHTHYSEMPNHTHPGSGFSVNVNNGDSATALSLNGSANGWGTAGSGAQVNSVANTGGNAAHNNMPPYYVVYYIIQAKVTSAVIPYVEGTAGGGGGSGFTYVTDVAPVATKAGDTWFDTSTLTSGGTSWVAVEESPGGEKVWVQFAPGIAAAATQGPLTWSGAYTGAAFGLTTSMQYFGACAFTAPWAGAYAVWTQANVYMASGPTNACYLVAAVDGVGVNGVGAAYQLQVGPDDVNLSDMGMIELAAGPHTLQCAMYTAYASNATAYKFAGMVQAVTKKVG